MEPTNRMTFNIDTEITPDSYEDLLKFFEMHYIAPKQALFTNVKRTSINNEHTLSFTFLEPENRWSIDVELKTGKPVQVKIVPSDTSVPHEAVSQLKEDLFIGVQLFEEQVRRTSLYFSWVENEPVVLEKELERHRDIIYKLFTESMLLFFIIFIAASIFLFIIFGVYTPILLVIIQFVMVLLSDKIIAKTGNWPITSQNRSVHIFQYHLPVEEFKELSQKFDKQKLLEIKAEIYDKTLAVGKDIDCQVVHKVFAKDGFECVPENMSTKVVNVYDIVKRTAETFKLPIPKIVISNTILPNAAASGPSPSHGIVLITTGLLVQLEDDEIYNVLGHEFSHLKGRDPLALFGLTSAEFLLRIYVFWPFLEYFGLLYIFFAFTVIYFVAKFFEGRADLEAAVKIGHPEVLAEALRKIGFRRLQFERLPSYRIQDWLGWDPHPPIYFRISRLEGLKEPTKVKHTFIRSIEDNIHGFLSALG
jgi:heat shock protein HtpX